MGVAKKMVREAMLLVSGNIKAEVKNSNSASIAVAISSGMTMKSEMDGVIYFSGIGLLAAD